MGQAGHCSSCSAVCLPLDIFGGDAGSTQNSAAHRAAKKPGFRRARKRQNAGRLPQAPATHHRSGLATISLSASPRSTTSRIRARFALRALQSPPRHCSRSSSRSSLPNSTVQGTSVVAMIGREGRTTSASERRLSIPGFEKNSALPFAEREDPYLTFIRLLPQLHDICPSESVLRWDVRLSPPSVQQMVPTWSTAALSTAPQEWPADHLLHAGRAEPHTRLTCI